MKDDMITGSPAKSLLKFALPMVLGNIFQQIYNIADSVIVGNFLGEKALAAVGASFAVTMLFICIAIGAGMGSGVLVSQFYGAKRYKEMKTAVYTSLISVSVIAVLFMGVGIAANRAILAAMGTPEDIYVNAVDYLQIYFYGMLFVFVYNCISSVFNALGDSKTPLYFLIISSVLNIVLDILFVTTFNMGVAGTAWATILSQFIVSLLSFIFLMKKLHSIETDEPVSVFNIEMLGKIGKIGLPSIVQQSIVSVGMLLVQSVVNRFGSFVVAGYTAATKIDSIAIVPMLAVGNAVSTFAAQNIGAKQTDRVKLGYRVGLLMVFAMGLFIAVMLCLFGENFIRMFLNSEASIKTIEAGVGYIEISAFFYIVFGFMNVTNGVLRGAGAVVAFLLSSLGSLGMRVFAAYTLSGMMGEQGIWLSSPIGWCAAFVFAYVYYKTGKWKNKSLI